MRYKLILIGLLVLALMVSGCGDNSLDETKYKCTDGWWTQYTTKYGMEMAGELPYDFEKNPQKYYNNLAKEFNAKLKDCGYTEIEGERNYGCSICYEWIEIEKSTEVTSEDREEVNQLMHNLGCDKGCDEMLIIWKGYIIGEFEPLLDECYEKCKWEE